MANYETSPLSHFSFVIICYLSSLLPITCISAPCLFLFLQNCETGPLSMALYTHTHIQSSIANMHSSLAPVCSVCTEMWTCTEVIYTHTHIQLFIANVHSSIAPVRSVYTEIWICTEAIYTHTHIHSSIANVHSSVAQVRSVYTEIWTCTETIYTHTHSVVYNLRTHARL